MKHWKRLGPALLLMGVVLTGCKKEQPEVSPSPSMAVTTPQPTATPEQKVQLEPLQLWVSNGAGMLTAYPYEGEETGEALLKALAEQTGWDLTLTDKITSGKGGMTVCFARDSWVSKGAPEEQRETYRTTEGADIFPQAVLTSVQETLSRWASPEQPGQVLIYFSLEGDQPLDLTGLGVEITWPLEEPYTYETFQALVEGRSGK